MSPSASIGGLIDLVRLVFDFAGYSLPENREEVVKKL
jgi:hypothetical protein